MLYRFDTDYVRPTSTNGWVKPAAPAGEPSAGAAVRGSVVTALPEGLLEHDHVPARAVAVRRGAFNAAQRCCGTHC